MADTTQIKQGERMPLSFGAHDGDDSLFVDAVLKDQDGIELGISPVNLNNIGDGQYTINTYTMPGHRVSVTYRPFLDAGKTIESQIHGPGFDEFIPQVAIESPPIVTNIPDRLVARVRDTVAQVRGQSSSAKADLQDNASKVIISDDDSDISTQQDQLGVRTPCSTKK